MTLCTSKHWRAIVITLCFIKDSASCYSARSPSRILSFFNYGCRRYCTIHDDRRLFLLLLQCISRGLLESILHSQEQGEATRAAKKGMEYMAFKHSRWSGPGFRLVVFLDNIPWRQGRLWRSVDLSSLYLLLLGIHHMAVAADSDIMWPSHRVGMAPSHDYSRWRPSTADHYTVDHR